MHRNWRITLTGEPVTNIAELILPFIFIISLYFDDYHRSGGLTSIRFDINSFTILSRNSSIHFNRNTDSSELSSRDDMDILSLNLVFSTALHEFFDPVAIFFLLTGLFCYWFVIVSFLVEFRDLPWNYIPIFRLSCEMRPCCWRL